MTDHADYQLVADIKGLVAPLAPAGQLSVLHLALIEVAVRILRSYGTIPEKDIGAAVEKMLNRQTSETIKVLLP